MSYFAMFSGRSQSTSGTVAPRVTVWRYGNHELTGAHKKERSGKIDTKAIEFGSLSFNHQRGLLDV